MPEAAHNAGLEGMKSPESWIRNALCCPTDKRFQSTGPGLGRQWQKGVLLGMLIPDPRREQEGLLQFGFAFCFPAWPLFSLWGPLSGPQAVPRGKDSAGAG